MKRRQLTSPSALDLSNPPSQSAAQPSSRASSPSVFSAFLRGPTTRWFTKGRPSPKQSDGDMPTRQLLPSPRRPNISQPSDPRPLLDIPRPSQLSSSQSHSDLPKTGSPKYGEPSVWNEPAASLVAISRRSRSVDDLTKSTEATEDPALVAQIRSYRNQCPPLHPSEGKTQKFEFPRIIAAVPTNDDQPARRKGSFDSARKLSFSNNMLPKIGKVHHSSFSSADHIATPFKPSQSREADGGLRHFDKSPSPSRPLFPHSNSNPVPSSRTWGLEVPKPNRTPTSPATDVRASQVIYRSGFLNRRAFASPNDTASLAKGWGPRKVLLKGTKLFFYKPPKDRIAEIRELFPTRLAAGAAPESVNTANDRGNGSSHSIVNATERESAPKRRPVRAFRGRSRHPQLVTDDKSGYGVVKQGSAEAFLHEVIFATTFDIGSSPSPVDSDQWREFAMTLLIVLPSEVMMGRARFENELIAHIVSLFEGIEDNTPSLIAALGRADWIVSKYFEYWGQFSDRLAWPALRVGVTSRVSSAYREQQLPSPSYRPSTPGAVAAEIPLPESPSVAQASRTFPRQSPPLLSPTREHAQLGAALQAEGFSANIMNRLPAEAVASSLAQWHHTRVLHMIHQDHPLVATIFETLSLGRGPSDDRDGNSTARPRTLPSIDLLCLFGTDSELHWLTRLVFLHIFGPPTNPGGAQGDQTARVSISSRSRGTTIAKWIEIAELCRRSGDDCTWMAVRSALSSRAVVRLERAWREVPPKLRKVVTSWVHVAPGEDDGRQQTLLAPWVGQDVSSIRSIAHTLRGREIDPTMAELMSLRRHVEKLLGRLRACLMVADDDRNHLMPLWKQWDTYSLDSRKIALSLDHYLELSYSVETRTKINFSAHHWKPPSEITFSPLTPIDFPRPFPIPHLVPQASSRAHSDPTGVGESLSSISEEYFRHVLNLCGDVANDARAWRRSPDMSSQGHSTVYSDNEIGDTFAFAYNGEIVLKVLRNMQPRRSSQYRDSASRLSAEALGELSGESPVSRPLGRAPSVSAAISGSLSRKASRISLLSRRSSLPSLSRGPSFMRRDVKADTSLTVVVCGGTLDRLIDVLIDGLEVTVSSTDDSGLSVGTTRTLCVDRQDFESSWWATFRSFVSAFVFFELLRKRFLQLQYSVTQSVSPADPDPRLRILDVMRQWILSGSGGVDLLDDPELFTMWYSFLDRVDGDLARNPPADAMLPPALMDLRRISELYTASPVWIVAEEDADRNSRTQTEKHGTAPPDIDRVSPEDLVENLDGIAEAVMSLVTTGDLLAVCDTLEVQLFDRALLLSKELLPSPEEVVPETMFTLLRNLEPSPCVTTFCDHDQLHKSFPSSIRLLLRMHATFRAWATQKLAAPGIGLRKREARIDLLLGAIEVCRRRSHAMRDEDRTIFDAPTVPSFVEVALLAAIWSPESRVFSRAWANVASKRGTQADSIQSLFTVPRVPPSHTKCVVDGGWLFEQLLGILSLPNTLFQREHILVHFDKRRYLCALARTFTRPSSHPTSNCDLQITRMSNMLSDVRCHEVTLQAAKDEAQREGLHASPLYGARRHSRPFQTLVAAQMEKNRKDRLYNDRLSKERKQEQQKVERRQQGINRAMNPTKQYGLNGKHQRGKKSMSSISLFFRAVRPLSTAWASDRNFSRQRTASELDFPATGKPSLVLSLNDAQAISLEEEDRPFMFQILTEDGGRWLLQASTVAELDSWLQAISVASRKRSTYIPHALKSVHSEPLSLTSSGQGAVFGVVLDELIARENNGIIDVEGAIPHALELCLSEIERRGLTEVGLYRVNGGTGTVNLIRKMFDEGETPDFANDDRFVDVHAICATVKSFLRQLPDPLIPFQYHNAAIASAGIKDYVERLGRIRILVHSLPRAHFHTLHRLIQHFDRVTDYEESNFMHAEGLAICIAPNLLRGPDPMSHLAYMGPSTSFVKNLILLFHSIFEDEGDADVEADVLLEESEPDDHLVVGMTVHGGPS